MSEQAQEPPGAYLGPVTVEGFRGVGRSAVLPLEPGPGLTLVVGRNGSGKSSFAEAVEILFTEDNRRWSQRSLIWREGWRNLHQPQPTQITVNLTVEGTRGGTRLRRHWPAGAELDHSVLEVQPHGRPKSDRLALGWEQALTAFRPFLSYNELGSMLDEGPSKLYDAPPTVSNAGPPVAPRPERPAPRAMGPHFAISGSVPLIRGGRDTHRHHRPGHHLSPNRALVWAASPAGRPWRPSAPHASSSLPSRLQARGLRQAHGQRIG